MKLSEKTKKLFDAPFAVMGDSEDYTKFNIIIHSKNSPRYSSTIASCIDQKTAIRFARVPELYEALKQAVYDCCEDCLCALDEFNDGEYECDENGFVKYDLIEKGCVFKERDCCPKCRSWIDILRKVREGE